MGIANSATIRADLVVTDKGSVVISNAATNASRAFAVLSGAARSTGRVIVSAFAGATRAVTSFLSHMFSLQSILLFLSGAGLVALFGKALSSLAERSAPLAERFAAIRDALGAFIGAVVEWIGSNPELLRMLDNLEFKLNELTYRIPEYYTKIDEVVNATVKFMTKTLPDTIAALKEAWTTARDVFQQIWDRINGFVTWIQSAWETVETTIARIRSIALLGSGVTTPYQTPGSAGEYVEDSTDTGGGMRPFFGGAVVNNYFNENISRSDAVSIATETERQSYRDGE